MLFSVFRRHEAKRRTGIFNPLHKACCKPKNRAELLFKNQGCIMSLYPIYNFSVSPAVLPKPCWKRRGRKCWTTTVRVFPRWRWATVQNLFEHHHHAEQDLRQLLKVPDNYKILLLQGGATTQFNMAAMNPAHGFRTADAVVTGNWSRIAYEQMSRLTDTEIRLAAHGGEQFDYLDLPPVETLRMLHPIRRLSSTPSMKRSTGCTHREVPRLSVRHAAAGVRYVQRDFCRASLMLPTTDWFTQAHRKTSGKQGLQWWLCVRICSSVVRTIFPMCSTTVRTSTATGRTTSRRQLSTRDLYVGAGVPLTAGAGRCGKKWSGQSAAKRKPCMRR